MKIEKLKPAYDGTGQKIPSPPCESLRLNARTANRCGQPSQYVVNDAENLCHNHAAGVALTHIVTTTTENDDASKD